MDTFQSSCLPFETACGTGTLLASSRRPWGTHCRWYFQFIDVIITASFRTMKSRWNQGSGVHEATHRPTNYFVKFRLEIGMSERRHSSIPRVWSFNIKVFYIKRKPFYDDTSSQKSDRVALPGGPSQCNAFQNPKETEEKNIRPYFVLQCLILAHTRVWSSETIPLLKNRVPIGIQWPRVTLNINRFIQFTELRSWPGIIFHQCPLHGLSKIFLKKV